MLYFLSFLSLLSLLFVFFVTVALEPSFGKEPVSYQCKSTLWLRAEEDLWSFKTCQTCYVFIYFTVASVLIFNSVFYFLFVASSAIATRKPRIGFPKTLFQKQVQDENKAGRNTGLVSGTIGQ